MSMYDDLYFEKSPFPKSKLKEFQTKSFDNVMDDYRITKDGRLQISEFKIRDPKSSEQREIQGIKLPFYVKEHTGWSDTDITGTIEAYNYTKKYYYGVRVIIIYGKVDKIETQKIPIGGK